MDRWFFVDRLFDGRELREGQGLLIRDGHVVEMGIAPADACALGSLVTPGFVDLQVNGGGGVQLNSTPTAEGMLQIAAAHRRFGTVAILPTVITDAPEVIDSAADAAIEAAGTGGVIGLHIEGPHLAMPRRGTHSADLIRPFDEKTLQTVTRLRRADVPVMITLAPEAVSCEQIARLSEMGAVVSLGHTDATAEEALRAIRAGANCATHLFNAMSPMLGREPGVVGTVINSDCYSGIICDGYHVADEMVAMAIRARPVADRMFLVSDAMATVGGLDHFTLYDEEIRLVEGRLVNAEGSLAGAHVTQAEGVKRLVDMTATALDVALRMVTSIPAQCMGRSDLGRLIGRPVEDLLVLDDKLLVTGSLADY